MKFCTKCGNELLDEAVLCPACGCSTENRATAGLTDDKQKLLQTLSSRIRTEAIIWIVIGSLQVLAGLLAEWFLLIIGVLNIVTAVKSLGYSKTILTDQSKIVSTYEPLTGPIITLLYNLIFGGVIGVAGSIYYFLAVRGFVMEHKISFAAMQSEEVL